MLFLARFQRQTLAAIALAAVLAPTTVDAQGRNDAYRAPQGGVSPFPGGSGPSGDGPLAPPQGGDVYYPPRGGPDGPGYQPPYQQAPLPPPGPAAGYEPPPRFDGRPPQYQPPYQAPGPAYPPQAYGAPRGPEPGYADQRYGNGGYGAPYSAPQPPNAYDGPPPSGPPPSGPPPSGPPPSGPRRGAPDGSFSSAEIGEAGRGFFGSLSQGMASAVEYTFKRQGRPNGYILGEEAGGAFFGGLRYGEGTLYTRDAGSFKVYWQGPSLGFDIGGEGNRVMVLIYNLRSPEEIFDRFAGVNGSAYVVGGVGVTFQQKDHVTLAPIRAGVGLRLGAAVGYLKYSRKPTWNPF